MGQTTWEGLKALMEASTGPWPILALIVGVLVLLAMTFFPTAKIWVRLIVFAIAIVGPAVLLVYVLGRVMEEKTAEEIAATAAAAIATAAAVGRFSPLGKLDNSFWQCVTDAPGAPPCTVANTRDPQIEVTVVTLTMLDEHAGTPPTQGHVKDAITITNGTLTGRPSKPSAASGVCCV